VLHLGQSDPAERLDAVVAVLGRKGGMLLPEGSGAHEAGGAASKI